MKIGVLLTRIGLLAFGAATLLTDSHFTAQAAAPVVLQSAFQTTNNPTLGQVNVFHPIIQNMTGMSQTVDLVLTLTDPQGNTIANKEYDSVTIDQYNVNDFNTETLTAPADLSVGTYNWNIEILATDTSVIGMYNDALSFVGPGTGESESSSYVLLKSTALGETHMNGCPPITLLFSNTGYQSRDVLVYTELKNSSGALVDTTVTDNYAVQSTGSGSQQLYVPCNVSSLPADSYTYSVGIFNPGWNGLLHWYSGVQNFTVQASSPASNPTIEIVTIDRPKSNVSAGSSFNVTPTLINAGSSNINNVSITVSLTDRNNQTPYSVMYTQQHLDVNSPLNFPLPVSNAQAGTYTIGVIVKDSTNSVIQSFSNLGTIVVM